MKTFQSTAVLLEKGEKMEIILKAIYYLTLVEMIAQTLILTGGICI